MMRREEGGIRTLGLLVGCNPKYIPIKDKKNVRLFLPVALPTELLPRMSGLFLHGTEGTKP